MIAVSNVDARNFGTFNSTSPACAGMTWVDAGMTWKV
jgi:hypothetical protein